MAEVRWGSWPAKFPSKCKCCGAIRSEGEIVFGTKDTSLAEDGKWFIVCPLCHADGVKPRSTKEFAESMMSAPVFEHGGHRHPGTTPPPKRKSDAEELAELLAAGFIGRKPATMEEKAEKIIDELEALAIKNSIPERPPIPEYTFSDVKREPKEPSPWSLLWIKQNACWGI